MTRVEMAASFILTMSNPAEGLTEPLISESVPAGVEALSWWLHSTSTAKSLSFDTP